MNKEQLKKGISNLKEISISKEEKNLILNAIIKKIEPLEKETSQNKWQMILGRPLWYRSFTPVLAVCLIILLVSGGTIFASENALPGDILYPVKINIAEPAGDILTVGITAKTKREAEKTDRRLNEAERLANEGRLDKSKSEEIHKQLKNSLAKFEALKQELEKIASTEEITDINSGFEATISAHSTILEGVGEFSTSSQKAEIDLLKKTVEEEKENMQVEREEVESQIKERQNISNSDFEKKEKEIDKYIKDTHDKLITDFDESEGVKKHILNNASGTLKKAQEKIKEAKIKNSIGKSLEAINSLNSAKRDADEASISIEKSSDFKGNKTEIKNNNNSTTTQN